MPPSPSHPSDFAPAIVTLQMIADRAGVAKSSVSYALNNHPKIPPATRERIQRVARELGHRSNPRVASLMTHIRNAHSREHSETIAFVWVHASREETSRMPYLRESFRGAVARARMLGFKLEQFFINDPGMTDRRLAQILRARGIVGVVFSPGEVFELVIRLDWDWSRFAMAVIGNIEWVPQLHCAAAHHFLTMRTMVLELQKLGCRRPALLLESSLNKRAYGTLEGAFLTFHPTPADARHLLRVQTYTEKLDANQWLDATRADALIVSKNEFFRMGACEAARKRGLPVVTEEWRQNVVPRGVGGICQRNDYIASKAVDLVVSQLHANETGVPDMPCRMLFSGKWIPPAIRPRRKSLASR